MSVRPERLAAAARAMQRSLLERLASSADRISDCLAADLGMVAWDREQLMGRVQRELHQLRDRRFSELGGEPVIVVERARQPLDCIVAVWERLRRGQRVALVAEEGACPAGLTLMHEMGRSLGEGVLRVAEAAQPPADAAKWTVVGVTPARPRVALVQADSDPELAAYVLARACLRRTGFEPRAVHHVVVAGPSEDVERQLRRLWVGARMGPPDEDGSFAGPVPPASAQAYITTVERLRNLEHVEVIVDGDRLTRPGDAAYLAPALLAVTGLGPVDPELCGPVLMVHRVERDRAEECFDVLAAPGHGRVRIGEARRGSRLGPEDRQFAGALLLERIPPGLPKPRP